MVKPRDEFRDQRRRPRLQRVTGLWILSFLAMTFGSPLVGDESSLLPVTEYATSPRLLISLLHEPLAAATSPDGKLLATGHNDGSVVLWNVETALPIRRLSGHDDTVGALAFDASGLRLASAGYDATVQVWDVETGDAVAVLSSHSGRLTAVAFSADGRHLASGGYDRSVRLWDLQQAGSEPTLFPSLETTVRCLAFSPDGTRLAVGEDNGTLTVRSVVDVSQFRRVEAHQGRTQVVQFSPDRQFLASGGDDGEVHLWDSLTLDRRPDPPETDAQPRHTAPVTSLAFSVNGHLLATGDLRGHVQTWDVAGSQVTSQLDGHNDAIMHIGFANAGESLLTVALDRTVHAWRSKIPVTPRLSTIGELASRLWTLAVSPDGNMLYAGGRDGLLECWSLPDHELKTRFVGFEGTVDVVAVAPDGAHLACCGWKHDYVMVFDTQTGEKSAELTTGSNARCVRFSPDGQQVVVGCEDGTLRVWALKADGDAQTVQNGPLPVYDVVFSPDGKQLVAGSGDWRKTEPGFVTFWNTDGWSDSQRLTEHTHAVRAVTFSSDGSRLASAGEDGQVILWHPETHVPLARWNNGVGARPIAFSPDGMRLAVGLHDGTINIWDVDRGEVVQRFQSEDDVFAVSYNHDGSELFSVSGEKRIEVWPTGGPQIGGPP